MYPISWFVRVLHWLATRLDIKRPKWSLIVLGVRGPPNEDETATRKAMVYFATNCLHIENAGQLQFVACHRLSNKADAATLIIFVVDLSERNRLLHHAKNLKNKKPQIQC